MALGKKLFEITYSDLIKGVSSSDVISDGGFSPNTDAVQLTFDSGAVYQSQLPTDASTGLTGEMIASCEDPTGNYTRLFVSQDGSQNGRFWSMNGSYALTQRGSTDSTHQYTAGKTDMIAFANEAYITSNSTLVRWSAIGAANTFDTAFFSFNNGLAPHPALTFNSFAYYGDGNILLRQSGAGVAPVAILTLAAGTIIVALGIDPGSGNILLSVIGQINLSDTLNSGARISFYDGFSSQVLRTVQVEDMVTCFAPTAGSLYVGYGQNLGLWNGSGITFLRHLSVDFDNNRLLYKHHTSYLGSTLLYIQNQTVMAYGPVRQKGDNVFYPALANNPGGFATNLTNISNVGSNIITISYATSKFAYWAAYSISGTASPMALYTNSYDFDDEVWIRRIRVIYDDPVPNSTQPGNLYLYTEDGIVSVGGNGSGAWSLQNTSGAASSSKTISNINFKVKMLQLRLLLDTGNYGIRRIIVYGDPANITGSPQS